MKPIVYSEPPRPTTLRTIQERIDLTYYLRAVYRRRWIAIAAFLAIVCAPLILRSRD